MTMNTRTEAAGMLDIKLLRDNPDLVRQALEKRGESAPLDQIMSLDEQRRQFLHEMETLRAQRNEVSKQLGGMADKPPQLIDDMRQVGEKITPLEAEIGRVESELEDFLLRLPNIPAADVPVGKGAHDNLMLRSWGEPAGFSFTPLPHWELGEKLGIIDFQRGVKLSGSRFYILKGAGANLQRALIAFMLDLHTKEHGYTEIYPPFMVKRECMLGSGNLPKFADNLYHDEEDDLWFVPTAEVPLTNLHRDEILPPGVLPIYYVAYTACFRREKMSAGRDTRGIKRGHHVDKVERYKLTEPSTSDQELEKLLNDAEQVCQKLGLPYRVKQLCTADLGFASQKSYDIETWAAGCEEWLEVSSCSDSGDFHTRRANICY